MKGKDNFLSQGLKGTMSFPHLTDSILNDFRKMLIDFLSLLFSCRHSSIVGYKEAFFEDSTSCLCIVMDYLDDGDLY